MLMAGTKTHTRQQITEALRELNAQVNVSAVAAGVEAAQAGVAVAAAAADVSSATASITAPAENFAAAAKIAVEILKEPAYPQDEFDRLRRSASKRSTSADRSDADGAGPAQSLPESVHEDRRPIFADARGAEAGTREGDAGRRPPLP